MRFTIVCYRSDGDDYCRGCLMSSSSSAFDLHVVETADEAGLRIAQKHFDDRDPKRDRAVQGWEVTLLINGGDSYDDDEVAEEARACVEAAAEVHLQRMVDEEAARELAEKQRLEAVETEAQKQKEAEKEQRERREYERLSAKFGY